MGRCVIRITRELRDLVSVGLHHGVWFTELSIGQSGKGVHIDMIFINIVGI
jgi:hypothetical protein